MTRFGGAGALFRTLFLGGLFIGLGLIPVTQSGAGEPGTEQRDFTIYVDGNQAGAYSMSITQREDGSQIMSASANVRVKYLGGLKVYRYSYRGTETWKAGRLVHFTSTSNDDGKEFTVSAVPEGNGLRLRVNGRDRMVQADSWLTTYWHLADAKFRKGGVPLVDADTGQELAAQLQYVEARQLNVAGEVQNCTQYRVTGDAQAELWYDAQERLIQLRSWSDGHRYELVLATIRR
jgi:Domain of unknown function (DUF6134)